MPSSSSSSSTMRSTPRTSRSSSRIPALWVAAAASLLVFLSTARSISAHPSPSNPSGSSSPLSKRADNSQSVFGELPNAVDYYNPNNGGGHMLTIIPDLDVGEPINIIVSGRSSRSVLTPVGFLLWATSINYGVSCLGSSDIGTVQSANLGDGYGSRAQGSDGEGINGVLRYNYGSPYFGTCKETFDGGSHMRWFVQNGTDADSSAIFIAASTELSLAYGHDIAQNGYNIGRDEIVGNATNAEGTSWEGNNYNTTVIWVPAGLLLNATSDGVNHPTVALPGEPAQDGMVAVLTITQLAGSASEVEATDGASAVGKVGATALFTLLAAGLLLAASL